MEPIIAIVTHLLPLRYQSQTRRPGRSVASTEKGTPGLKNMPKSKYPSGQMGWMEKRIKKNDSALWVARLSLVWDKQPKRKASPSLSCEHIPQNSHYPPTNGSDSHWSNYQTFLSTLNPSKRTTWDFSRPCLFQEISLISRKPQKWPPVLSGLLQTSHGPKHSPSSQALPQLLLPPSPWVPLEPETLGNITSFSHLSLR